MRKRKPSFRILSIDWRGWIVPTLGEAVMIAVIFCAGRCSAQVYIPVSQPPVLMPAQPVTVATYRPLTSLFWGQPSYSYHVAYVLRPPQPPVQAQPQGPAQ